MDSDDDLVEVFATGNRLAAEAAVEDILRAQGIDAVIHDRVSHMIPAPASMPGAYFVAVPAPQADRAIQALQEALSGGLVDGEMTAGLA